MIIFNEWRWKKLGSHMGKTNFNLLFTTYTKSNSKWITFLNVKYKIIKLLEETIGENLYDLKLTPRAKLIK